MIYVILTINNITADHTPTWDDISNNPKTNIENDIILIVVVKITFIP